MSHIVHTRTIRFFLVISTALVIILTKFGFQPQFVVNLLLLFVLSVLTMFILEKKSVNLEFLF